MPKLNSLIACEKIIFDAGGMPSLINVFQRVLIQADDPLPDDALSPMSWAIFTLWQHEEHELNEQFVQQVEVVMPNETVFVSSTMPFKITAAQDLQSKNAVNIFGIPAAKEGMCRIRVRLNGGEILAEYSFFIKHVRKENDENASTSAIL